MGNELENFIRNNIDALDRKKPDPAVLERVLDNMKPKRNNKPAGIVIPLRFVQWAVACLLLVACGLAVWYFTRPQPATGVATTDRPGKRPLPAPKTEPAERAAVVVKQEAITTRPKAVARKVVKREKTAVLAGLSNMQSAASRINAIASTARMKDKGNRVVDALVQTLNTDPNTNVRLAALDGLTRYHKKAYVRKELVASLNKQHDPLVQIDLIGLLTHLRELSILSELERIVNDETIDRTVKDIAWSGILQLRPAIIN